jgi:hypothetical protein
MKNEALTKALHSAGFLDQELRDYYPHTDNPAEQTAVLDMIDGAVKIRRMLEQLESFHSKPC